MTTFGVSGKLWRDSLVMYDRASKSLWSQIAGRAVAGERVGERLAPFPSVMTSWGRWRADHPESLVLKPKRPIADYQAGRLGYEKYAADAARVGVTGQDYKDRRLPPKELVFGLLIDTQAIAYSVARLRKEPLIHDRVADLALLVWFDGSGAAAYRREVEGRELHFTRVGEHADRLRDSETGSVWAFPEGRAIEGPMAGRRLALLPGHPAFWYAWSSFHPETVLAVGGP